MNRYDWLEYKRTIKLKAVVGILTFLHVPLMLYFVFIGVLTGGYRHPGFWALLGLCIL